MISEPIDMNFFDCNTKIDLLVFLISVLTHLASTSSPLILVTMYLLVLSNQKKRRNCREISTSKLNIFANH